MTKDLIIPSVVVAVVFGVILIVAGIWVLNRKPAENPAVTDMQQSTEQMMNTMDNTNTSTNNSGAAPYQITEGLTAQDTTEGSGTPVSAGQTVAVKYVGKLDDGTIFDASDNHPDANGGFTFQLGAHQVIQGWDLGVVGMKPGGVRELTIAPELGYGAQGAGGVIPPNATLHFTVTLIGPVGQ